MSFDDTDNDINDIGLVILKPRSLTAAAPQLCTPTLHISRSRYVAVGKYVGTYDTL